MIYRSVRKLTLVVMLILLSSAAACMQSEEIASYRARMQSGGDVIKELLKKSVVARYRAKYILKTLEEFYCDASFEIFPDAIQISVNILRSFQNTGYSDIVEGDIILTKMYDWDVYIKKIKNPEEHDFSPLDDLLYDSEQQIKKIESCLFAISNATGYIRDYLSRILETKLVGLASPDLLSLSKMGYSLPETLNCLLLTKESYIFSPKEKEDLVHEAKQYLGYTTEEDLLEIFDGLAKKDFKKNGTYKLLSEDQKMVNILNDELAEYLIRKTDSAISKEVLSKHIDCIKQIDRSEEDLKDLIIFEEDAPRNLLIFVFLHTLLADSSAKTQSIADKFKRYINSEENTHKELKPILAEILDACKDNSMDGLISVVERYAPELAEPYRRLYITEKEETEKEKLERIFKEVEKEVSQRRRRGNCTQLIRRFTKALELKECDSRDTKGSDSGNESLQLKESLSDLDGY
ncbi:hypothetical protein NEMIN01_0643 [Nematocida minor]|uniref:uncharacterized protein n=1 Tax=Nematocida minor TaxID=1912983 RepID=UPI00221F109E|nr:uncharacterized protein NEMIN01_0643 [Nematocida minor]KAI5189690.1 hypothetical protein NEMIN01_0643 [Nematocida minor]